jgi:plastocyanin
MAAMKRARCPVIGILFGLGAAAVAGATTYTVQIGPGGTMTFSPSVQTITVGDTVHWVWEGSPHSTTSGSTSCAADGLWNSGIQNVGFTFDHTFLTAGTYTYFCLVHCIYGMTGTIVVNPPPVATQFYSLTPCRVVDTRSAAGPYGGPSLAAGADRTFVFGGQCGVPSTAVAVAVNVVAVLPTDGPGFLTLWPGALARPLAATMNYNLGGIRANNAIIPLGALADIAVHCGQGTGTVDMVVDVNGYFQ